MFFTNISEYSNKKLNIIYIISLIVYFGLMLISPLLVIASRYEMFKETGVKALTGFGICILLAFAVVGLRALRSKIDLFPENTMPQRRVKFTCQLFYSLFLPLIVIAVLFALHADFETAFATIRDSIIFCIGGILVDNLVVKYVESERKLRFDAQRDVEKQKRIHLFK